MKKISVTISFDEEKLAALKMYLAQKNMQKTLLKKSRKKLKNNARK